MDSMPYFGGMSDTKHERLVFLRNIICELKQRELAELIGTNTSTIAGIEIGQKPLSPEMAQRIANATGVSSLWLYGKPGDREGKINFSEPAVDDAGRDFKNENFKAHRLQTDEPANAPAFARAASLDLGIRVDRALRAGVAAGKTAAFNRALDLFLKNTVLDLGMRDEYLAATDHKNPLPVEDDPHDLVTSGRDWAPQMLSPAFLDELSELDKASPEQRNSLRMRAITLFYYLDHRLGMRSQKLPLGIAQRQRKKAKG